MVEGVAKISRPVLTTALLQIGLLAQMIGEVDRTVGYVMGLDPVDLLPEAYPGQGFILSTLALSVLGSSISSCS